MQIPLPAGTEYMVKQCHKAMSQVKKRYLLGQYCVDDPEWKTIDTTPHVLQTTGSLDLNAMSTLTATRDERGI